MNRSPLEDLIPIPPWVDLVSDAFYQPTKDLAVILGRPIGKLPKFLLFSKTDLCMID